MGGINELIVRNLAGFSTGFVGGGLVNFAAQYLIWVMFISYLLVLVWRPGPSRRQEFLFVLVSVLAAWVLGETIKYFYLSPRPFLLLDNFTPLLRYGGDESFPSTHAITSFAFAFAVYSYRRGLGNVYLLIALMISLARIAAGLHWPSDVIGGFILAGIIVFVFQLILKGKQFNHDSILRMS